jgi:hypothetical protein
MILRNGHAGIYYLAGLRRHCCPGCRRVELLARGGRAKQTWLVGFGLVVGCRTVLVGVVDDFAECGVLTDDAVGEVKEVVGTMDVIVRFSVPPQAC